MLIDAHNHLQDPRFEGRQAEVIAVMKDAGIRHAVVNGTEEEDWRLVGKLAEEYPDFVIPSFGLHPWKVMNRSSGWDQTLEDFLTRFPSAGLGECGLDRWIKEPHFNEQLKVFQRQLRIASERNRACTIHCLKAWGPLMQVLRDTQPLPQFLLHSFNGSIEIAHELTDLGAYFSFSGYFLHPRKKAQLEVFRQLPKERILLETDAPDMLPPEEARSYILRKWNHPANLNRIAERFEAETQHSADQCAANTGEFFKLK